MKRLIEYKVDLNKKFHTFYKQRDSSQTKGNNSISNATDEASTTILQQKQKNISNKSESRSRITLKNENFREKKNPNIKNEENSVNILLQSQTSIYINNKSQDKKIYNNTQRMVRVASGGILKFMKEGILSKLSGNYQQNKTFQYRMSQSPEKNKNSFYNKILNTSNNNNNYNNNISNSGQQQQQYQWEKQQQVRKSVKLENNYLFNEKQQQSRTVLLQEKIKNTLIQKNQQEEQEENIESFGGELTQAGLNKNKQQSELQEFHQETEQIVEVCKKRVSKLINEVYKEETSNILRDKLYQIKRQSDVQNYLTQFELLDIINEFGSIAEDRDLDKLDQMLKKLQYFGTLSKQVRYHIYNIAIYECYNVGDIVFREGDYGEYVYIILSGDVNVRCSRDNHAGGGKRENVIIATLSDGQIFGELAMIGTKTGFEDGVNIQEILKNVTDLEFIQKELDELDKNQLNGLKLIQYLSTNPSPLVKQNQLKELLYSDGTIQTKLVKKLMKEMFLKDYDVQVNEIDDHQQFIERQKRLATIECTETCHLLKFTREQFQSIILKSLQKSLDHKLNTIQMLTCFQGFRQFVLLPLAFKLESSKYKMGQVILKAGEIMNKLYIVGSGYCEVVTACLEKKSKQPYKDQEISKLQSKRFKFKDIGDESATKNTGIQSPEKFEEPLCDKYSYPVTTLFDSDKVKLEDQQYYGSVRKIVLKTLKKGEIFGGRALYNVEDRQFISSKQREDSFKPAKFTVIAGCNNTEVFTLDRKNLAYIPNMLLALLKAKEYDDQSTDEQFDKIKNWFKEKKAILKSFKKN